MGAVIKGQKRHVKSEVSFSGNCPVDDLVGTYRGLVTHIARHYSSANCPFEDLVQEGYLGLLKASERFDETLGCKYATYATYWIKHYISRYVAKHDRLVRIPIKKSETYRKILKVREMLSREKQVDPTLSEVADYARMDEADVKSILDLFQSELLLESPLGESQSSHYDVIRDTRYAGPEGIYFDEEVKEQVQKALNKLISKERDILKLRFGIDTQKMCTLKEVADIYNMSSETIRQIEKRAMRKMRNENSCLREYIA